jgi:hypothetical protein
MIISGRHCRLNFPDLERILWLRSSTTSFQRSSMRMMPGLQLVRSELSSLANQTRGLRAERESFEKSWPRLSERVRFGVAFAELDEDAPFDWVIRNRRFHSFRSPEGTALMEVLDEGTVETVETSAISASDDIDDENAFIELLGRTLRVQFEDTLSFDRESRALYFRSQSNEHGVEIFLSIANQRDLCLGRVAVGPEEGWKGRKRQTPRVCPAFPSYRRRLVHDGHSDLRLYQGWLPHHFASDLLSGKKRLEKNGAVRGQFLMWRYLLTGAEHRQTDLLSEKPPESGPLSFETLEPIQMPMAVPEEAWKKEDPNAGSMEDHEWLL